MFLIFTDRYGNGQTKRAVDLTEDYVLCNRATYGPEIKRCHRANRPDLLVFKCRILASPHCSYTVDCKKKVGQSVWTCPDPVHSM